MSASPYPGLRPFRRDETDIFFGREEQTDQILDKLGQSRFLAVVGPSGCGKSSLLRAGVIAALETGFLAVAGARWRIVEMRPGDRPLRRLAEALIGESALRPERGAEPDAIPFLHATLRRGPLGLVEALRETPQVEQANLLLLVDQFEEIFRYRQQGNRDEADAFVTLLLETAKQREVPVYVVMAMRSDYLGDCALFNGLPEAMNESQFLTPRLTREQRRAAIVGPAKVFGGEVESALVNRLLNDMGAAPDQLPLMQHVLMRMWTRASDALQPHGTASDTDVAGDDIDGSGMGMTLTVADYEAVGGIADALSNHANEALAELDVQQQYIAEVLFRCLSERGIEGRDTRRPVRLDEVASVAGVSPKQIIAVVEVFRRGDRSFIIPPVGTSLTPDSILDISHESLIRQWKRMNKWVEREAASAETYRRLEQNARLWQNGEAALWGTPDLENALAWKEREKPTPAWAKRYGGHFDLGMEFLAASERERDADLRRKEEARQRELKQTRRLLKWVSVVLLVVLLIAGWAVFERFRADAQRAAANRAKLDAQGANSALIKTLEYANLATQLAEKERNRAQEIAGRLFANQVTLLSRLAHARDYATAEATLAEIQASEQDIPGQRRPVLNLLDWFVKLMGGSASSLNTVPEVKLKKVAISSGGKFLAAVGDKGVALFDASSGKSPKLLQEHKGDVNTAVFHPQGDWLASGGDDGSIILWTLPEGTKKRILREDTKQQPGTVPGKVWALAVSPDGKILASGGSDTNIALWAAETGSRMQTLTGHMNSIYALAFSRDGLLASASYDYTARIWDPKARKQSIATLKRHGGRVYGVAFSPDGQFLATGGGDNAIHLWKVKPLSFVREFEGHEHKVFGIVFVENGRRLVSVSFDRTVRVWDTDSGVTLQVLQSHKGAVTGVAADHTSVFSIGEDGWQRWDEHLERNKLRLKIVNLPDDPVSTALALDGSSVAVGFTKGGLRLYRLPDFHVQWDKADAHTRNVTRLAFSPDGRQLASASLDGTVKLWRVGDGQTQNTLEAHMIGVNAVAFDGQGKFLATAGNDGRIGLFELPSRPGKFYQAYEKSRALSVGFDISGRNLVSTGEDGRTSLWNLETRPPDIRTLHKSEEPVTWGVFDSLGSCIASVGVDMVLRILKTVGGCKEQELRGHAAQINRAVFGPDGNQVATISSDKTVRLWDLTIGAELFAIRLPENGSQPGPSDFDFRCTRQEAGGNCWISVPLSRGRLVLYHLGQIYDRNDAR